MWEGITLTKKSKKWIKEEIDWLEWHIEVHKVDMEEDRKDIKLLKKELKKRSKK